MKDSKSRSSVKKAPAFLVGLAVLALVIILVIFWTDSDSDDASQPGKSGEAAVPPATAVLLSPAPATLTHTALPSPSSAPSDTPEPTNTSEPVNTAIPTGAQLPDTVQPASSPEVLETGTSLPTASPGVPALPGGSWITFQIRNRTFKTVYARGYGIVKSIPPGLTVYFQAPDWGVIDLIVCKSADEGTLGGCSHYSGPISPSNQIIEVTR
jgi:hypothetical protein